MNSQFPDNLYSFYQVNTSLFEEKTNSTKQFLYYGLLGLCVLLVIMPSIIPMPSLIVRILAVIGIIFFGFAAFLGNKDYYNKQSGGKIKSIAIKKFDCSVVSEETLIELFYNGDFEAIAKIKEENNQPLQLYIHEDEKGKVFYLQLMKYFSQSDFRGITEVKIISEPEYSIAYKTIKSIKST